MATTTFTGVEKTAYVRRRNDALRAAGFRGIAPAVPTFEAHVFERIVNDGRPGLFATIVAGDERAEVVSEANALPGHCRVLYGASQNMALLDDASLLGSLPA